eukprot:scaffold55415_cov50-Prasinocladus_malaysianus.AAC.1
MLCAALALLSFSSCNSTSGRTDGGHHPEVSQDGVQDRAGPASQQAGPEVPGAGGQHPPHYPGRPGPAQQEPQAAALGEDPGGHRPGGHPRRGVHPGVHARPQGDGFQGRHHHHFHGGHPGGLFGGDAVQGPVQVDGRGVP